MRAERQDTVILLAEDDPDDQMFVRQALRKASINSALHTVNDGEELLDYLYRRGAYSDPSTSPLPDLILLDLNMPRKDGREALRVIKADQRFRKIPVVALTTSGEEDEIEKTYDLGVNAFVTKPSSFSGLAQALQALGQFWLNVVKLPTGLAL